MSNSLKIDNNYFFKGFFHWFGIEKNPMSEKVEDLISPEPQTLIKKDLQKIRKNYRKSYNDLKKEILTIE